MAKSNTQSRGEKHIFSHLIKLLILTFCFCYAASPAFTLQKVFTAASLATSYVKDKINPKEPQPLNPESESLDAVSDAEPDTSPSTSASTDAASTPGNDDSAASLGEYEVTGTTELALRKDPTTDSAQIATMHQGGQNQGEKIIRLNPPEGQQSEYFYYVLFTDSAGNEIKGWAGNKYLSPSSDEDYNEKAELVDGSNMFSNDPRFDESGKATGNYSADRVDDSQAWDNDAEESTYSKEQAKAKSDYDKAVQRMLNDFYAG